MIRTAFFADGANCLLPCQKAENSIGAEMPFRDEAVRGKRTVQRTGGNSVDVWQITPRNCSQPHEIEVGVLGYQRIESPLDEADAARQGVFPLE